MLSEETNASSRKARMIESDSFPLEFLSAIAERESWRKEIYRPVYHIHKWWAKRLGSIFRGIILGCLLQEDENLEASFYQRHNFSDVSIFDPFMGSGTTLGEAHKLGCTALGRDINPVACEGARIAFGQLSHNQLQDAHAHLSNKVGERILGLYRSTDRGGQVCDVLYYFWVKYVRCPHCSTDVDLFSTRIIARNAYPERKPEVQICCPLCSDIFPSLNQNKNVCCRSCGLDFDPHHGAAVGARATCPACSRSFSILDVVRASGRPPAHRLYCKLLLDEAEKRYLPASREDILSYEKCSELLRVELERGAIHLPEGVLKDGFNTRQAINYNYRVWRDFFNDRQLLALGWLHSAIADLPDASTRDPMLTIFSGLLEFNNVFASYKGEGTGAVRHMFSHHILKPERAPIEANVWGTPKSSGSFTNLFKARLLRTLKYRMEPFEAAMSDSGKAYKCSLPFSGRVEDGWPEKGNFKTRGIYLSRGSSDNTCLPDASVDFVITDPPFFDNVHYSELADFFYAWQSLYPRGFIESDSTTRHPSEVQDADPDAFARKLLSVFLECRRMLKDTGMLVFTYHHSRAEGWESLVEALFGAGFSVVNAHPVKAEMSVAAPKSQAKDPIQLDIILVCRKQNRDERAHLEPSTSLDDAARRACQKLARLRSVGLNLSQNDCRVTVISHFICSIGPVISAEAASDVLVKHQAQLERVAQSVYNAMSAPADSTAEGVPSRQMALSFDQSISETAPVDMK